MKSIPYLLILLYLSACNTISKEEYLANTCDCLQGVELTSEQLKEDIGDCLENHFVAYRKGADYSIQRYLEEHPTATKQEAQNNVIENLHIELLEKCPKYKELNAKLEAQNAEE